MGGVRKRVMRNFSGFHTWPAGGGDEKGVKKKVGGTKRNYSPSEGEKTELRRTVHKEGKRGRRSKISLSLSVEMRKGDLDCFAAYSVNS